MGWLLESKFHKRLSVKDLFLASLYSYLCSYKNLEATVCELPPAPPPWTPREVFLHEIRSLLAGKKERAQ